MTIKLRESGILEKKGNSWRVRVINAGQGSSGNYSADVLKEYGSIAWPSGTQIFKDHLTENEHYDRSGNHSIDSLVGVTTTNPEWVEEDQGLYADIRIFTHYADFVREAFEHIGLSVEANGVVDDEGNVVQIAPSPLNAIAVVPRAGRGGKFKELQEKYIEPDTLKVVKDERVNMTEEQITALAESIVAGIKPAFDELKESLKPVEPVEEVEEVADLSAVTESALEAGLSKTARGRVVASVREGATPEEAIASEKLIAEEYKALAEADVVGRQHDDKPGTRADSLDSIFGGGK